MQPAEVARLHVDLERDTVAPDRVTPSDGLSVRSFDDITGMSNILSKTTITVCCNDDMSRLVMYLQHCRQSTSIHLDNHSCTFITDRKIQ